MTLLNPHKPFLLSLSSVTSSGDTGSAKVTWKQRQRGAVRDLSVVRATEGQIT